MRSIDELFKFQTKLWKEHNQNLFGLSATDTDDPSTIAKQLQKDADVFWNKGTCLLKEHLIGNKKIAELDLMLQNTFAFAYKEETTTIGLFAAFLISAEQDGKELSKKKLKDLKAELDELQQGVRKQLSDSFSSIQLENIKIEQRRIATIPLITELGYKIRQNQYVLRTQAYPNTSLIKKVAGTVSYKAFGYENGEFKDGYNFFDEINEISKELLTAVLKKPVTKDTFAEALDKLPEYNPSDIAYFRFKWFRAISDFVLHGRHTASINKNRSLNYAQMLLKLAKYKKSQLEDVKTNLIMCENNIRALEVARQIIYPAREMSKVFTFEMRGGGGLSPFDAFKTQQSKKTAGRTRTLLDPIEVTNDDLLIYRYRGKTYTQFDLVFGNIPKTLKDHHNISVLSKTPFNFLNDPKRLMLAHKLRSQAIPVKGELSKLTHEIQARVVFADMSGYSAGDSLIISESFAKRLETTITKKFELQNAPDYFSVGDEITQEILTELNNKNRWSGWHDIQVIQVSQDFFIVKARVPFGVGDKITNLHASKGIVSLILPDDKMPRLVNGLSKNMKAGPVDVVVPGVAIYKRKSVAQIFEAAATALGLDFSLDELEKHKEELKTFDKNSIFELDKKKFQAPCGLQVFVRLIHDASTKQSFSWLKSYLDYALHFGEQEQTNLVSRGKYMIASELDVRAIDKHKRSLSQIKQMQETGAFDPSGAEPERLDLYLQLLGFDYHYKELKKEDIDARFWELYDAVDNKEIDLWEA